MSRMIDFIENYEFDYKNSTYNSFDHMVYLRVFEGCNLSCEHCFIPPNPKKIDLSFFENSNFTNILFKNSKIKEGETVFIQWHGGEPTALGVDYVSNVLDLIEKDKRLHFKHGIQTNLINFSKDIKGWTNLFKQKFNSEIGVSWDPLIRKLKNGPTKTANQDYEDLFWANVREAQNSKLDLYFVITLTKIFFDYFKNPYDFFEFLNQKGIKKVNLERITKTGLARSNWATLGLSNKEYSDNMAIFFKAYMLFKRANPNIELNISPFDGLIISMNSLNSEINASGYGCWSGGCDTNFHTIDANGYKFGCTALTSEVDNSNKILKGEIAEKKIIWIQNQNKTNSNHIQQIRSSRRESCVGCKYISICSSGCLSVEKWDSSGECSGAKHLFDTVYKFSKLI